MSRNKTDISTISGVMRVTPQPATTSSYKERKSRTPSAKSSLANCSRGFGNHLNINPARDFKLVHFWLNVSQSSRESKDDLKTCGPEICTTLYGEFPVSPSLACLFCILFRVGSITVRTTIIARSALVRITVRHSLHQPTLELQVHYQGKNEGRGSDAVVFEQPTFSRMSWLDSDVFFSFVKNSDAKNQAKKNSSAGNFRSDSATPILMAQNLSRDKEHRNDKKNRAFPKELQRFLRFDLCLR